MGGYRRNAWVVIAEIRNDDGSRSEKVILKELDGYKGIIQSDGLGAYKKVAMLSGGKITRVACLPAALQESLSGRRSKRQS